jgi:transposase
MVKDVELYRHLLGIVEPWTVDRVEMDPAEHRVDVWAAHPAELRWPCPDCGQPFPLFDHAEERIWRHLDSCNFQTYLHARVPRVECPRHGKIQVRVPWAEPHSRFTALFERWSIQVMQETDTAAAAELLGISWDEAWGIQERAVARGLAAKPPLALRQMGVDEKAVGHGQQYMTLVYNLEKSTVEWVGEGRRKETLDAFFESLRPEQREAIEAVGVDMWDPFIASILEHVPGGSEKLVFDRFHIAKHANEGVDKVRKSESRELWKDGDPTLKGSKYLWLYRGENLPEKHRDRFAALQALHLRTGRAYALKEARSELWSYQSLGWARKYWARWYFWATHSRLAPMVDVARMVRDHLTGVMNYFSHRITNAVAEGLNSKIATIQKMAYGFRNKTHFRTAVLFRCGGLPLYPRTPEISG